MEYIIFLIMKQKGRFKIFGNFQYRLSVHEWSIYRYRPEKKQMSISTNIANYPKSEQSIDCLVHLEERY